LMNTLIFAYGSMMALEQMRSRCPNARRLGRARFPENTLCFPRYSVARKGAVAGVRSQKASSVWGVLWELNADDLFALDRHEGFVPGRAAEANAYNRRTVSVLAEGYADTAIEADLYDAVPQLNPGLPSKGYLEHLVVGATEAKLPSEYIQSLRSLVGHRNASELRSWR
jgi:gamma-glutamylcyclotransferase